MHRRQFVRKVLSAAGVAALPALGAPTRWLDDASGRLSAAEPPAGGRPGSTRVLLIGNQPDHPPGTHLYLDECRLLARCLEQTPGVVATVSDGWPRDASVLDGVAALVLYSSPGAEILYESSRAARVRDLLEGGVGLTALHWATGIGDANDVALRDRFCDALGGVFGFGWSALEISRSRVEQVQPQHPICRGWTDFDLQDEWYLNLKFRPDIQPIAKVHVKDQDQVVAWAYQRPGAGGGRSYGNTLGHFHENFLLEPFRRAIVNGILWTAYCEIPASGAPCGATGG